MIRVVGGGAGPRREEFSALRRYSDDYDSDGGRSSDDDGERHPPDDAEFCVSVSRSPKPPPGPPRARFAAMSAAMLALGAAAGLAAGRVRNRESGGGAGGGGQRPAPPPVSVSVSEDDDYLDDDAPSFDEDDGGGVDDSVNGTDSVPPLPPLSDLVRGSEIISDVSWLLDFAVVDFPKCGTTFLMNYLSKSDEAYLNQGEVCSMDRNRPHKIVKRYHPLLTQSRFTSDGRRIRYGLKCPEELETEFALDAYTKYFPRTNFIVTMRHPVLWFQSYYNFRAYNSYPLEMPPTDDLIGPCREGYPYVPWNCGHHCPEGNMKVCTQRATFHHTLSRLGKTPMDTPEEMDLLGHHNMSVVPTTNQIFLMENRQIVLENPASATFPQDLRDFLGLENDLNPLVHFERKPGHYSNEETFKKRIDICDDQHKKAREVLVRHGAEAARWIREYFIKSPDVVVSSPERFVELLDDWGTDPCDEREGRLLLSDLDLD